MNLLVIGSGAREHALIWKLAKSPKVKKIYAAPGNAGISKLARCANISPTESEALLLFAKRKGVDLTVVGPEGPLAAGLVDRFQKEGLKIFGPTQAAARLESSKVFTKEFCTRHNIPTAAYEIFDNAENAKNFLKDKSFPAVIKADGLAQGKGVFVCARLEEALKAVEDLLVRKTLGEAGSKIVIENFLKGEEISFMAFVDGKHIVPLSSAKDYKRLLDGDEGPNTGGMGAYSPVSLVNATLYEKIMDQVMRPTIHGMSEESTPFTGILYAGLMVVEGQPHLLEFNVRLGDPEAQVILPRLKTDLVELMETALACKLGDVKLSWETKAAVCVVMASKGYPQHYQTGLPIQGLEEAQSLAEVFLFHAGTKAKNGHLMVAGGRVLSVTALGSDLSEAAARAYEGISKISWQDCYYRKDIGGPHG